MRTMIDAPPSPATVPMAFRTTQEFRRRVAMNVRKGRPGEPLYFATASDLMQAAVASYLDQIEAKDAKS
ncbi:hypothetical protein HJB78_00890 [Rhizobium lentis]|uniref:hypothetical protein n=1 Tax=Rhizobium lentis TaxID=1138194 RepID=UPI001C82E3E1|nr:hypothetical protein [Rhizobium lentis]MBX5149561.1 hypothetical protein [Rhizobium lentis]